MPSPISPPRSEASSKTSSGTIARSFWDSMRIFSRLVAELNRLELGLAAPPTGARANHLWLVSQEADVSGNVPSREHHAPAGSKQPAGQEPVLPSGDKTNPIPVRETNPIPVCETNPIPACKTNPIP